MRRVTQEGKRFRYPQQRYGIFSAACIRFPKLSCTFVLPFIELLDYEPEYSGRDSIWIHPHQPCPATADYVPALQRTSVPCLLKINSGSISIHSVSYIIHNPSQWLCAKSSAKSNTKHPICFCIVNVGTARCITALSPPPPLQTPYGISNPVWNRHIKS